MIHPQFDFNFLPGGIDPESEFWYGTWTVPWSLYSPRLFTPGFGVPRETFGPIAGPVDIPPLFGPIAGPVEREVPMPFAPLVPTSRPSDIRGRLISFGLDLLSRRFLPGQTTQTSVGFPGTGIPTTQFPERMAGQVTQRGCDCLIEKQMPAYTRKQKGRAVFGPDGSFLGCTPKRRSMNPMNGRAATRAARRLTSVMRFQKKIQKAVRKACGTRGRGRVSSFGGGRKKSCAK